MRKASNLYEDFHKYGPKKVTRANPSFRIPKKAMFCGPAIDVLYRSSKYDPITYQPPGAPINYIHEHESGVKVYWCGEGGEDTRVPRKVSKADNELTCLGEFLGCSYIDENEDEIEIECSSSKVELYAVPNPTNLCPEGHALLIVENKRDVVAMIWGGKLRVEPRGIVG